MSIEIPNYYLSKEVCTERGFSRSILCKNPEGRYAWRQSFEMFNWSVVEFDSYESILRHNSHWYIYDDQVLICDDYPSDRVLRFVACIECD